jgi:hypothetical protein
MARKFFVPALLLFLGALLLVLTPSGQVLSQEIRRVIVTNFPDVQRIDGEVRLKEPVMSSRLTTITEVIVPPVRPTETTRLVEAGTLVTEGFPEIVLSLHGQVKGSVQRQGTVGAILLPDQDNINQAFDEQGLTHFSLQVEATGIRPGEAYFASTQPVYTVAFQSYRVLLYNTTDKTVTVDLYAYLTS